MKIEDNKYKRLPNTQSFGIYLGLDNLGRTSLFVKLSKKPMFTTSSRYLIFEYNKRHDGLWALTVSIAEQQYSGVFNKLITDLVETVQDTENSLVAERMFIQRFVEWKTLFEQEVNTMLDFNKIVGLAGELFFLSEFMVEKYGIVDSLNAWSGPIGADKDFNINNTWYEVKTKSLKKDTIHLNSQTQLISFNIGYLTVVSYEKSSLANSNSTNLFDLYQKISKLIETQSLQLEFDRKLANLNFIPDEKYKEINLLFHQIEFYEVNERFPQISNVRFDKVITNIEYDLFLPELKHYKIEV
ncbi:PD-(D/E)XK motif protein [uncultured Psychrobacillus sp.]|uniref:PD-(D/E)XK motif protein n=1 Tax=uncultured Psychrobacillus sp. TaxID=1551585 RepID=UPI002630F675|nr:PD-(D/E)XK motif protein [uncultured Psychrobacillus sp.]